LITLNYRDSRPIYSQIKDGLRKLIVSGAVAPGERLPSVRDLATQLAINPNTIQRAYRELDNEGLIYSIPGKGSFAAKYSGIDPTKRDQLYAKLDEILSELCFIGILKDDILAHVSAQLADNTTHLGGDIK
jgi:GntR family transcriptional regulator